MSPCTIIFVLIITHCICVEVPSSIKKCTRKDDNLSECLKEAVNDVFSKSKSPVKEIGLPILDPLEVPEVTIPAGNAVVGFQQNYKDVKVTGFSDAKCSSVNMNFDTNIFSIDCSSPLVKLAFDYEADGKILLLPIKGKGPGTIELENSEVKIFFKLEEYEKDGKKYYRGASTKFDLTPQLVKIHLDNLFDGDKALGDNVNQVFNDNWKDVFADVKSNYEEALGQIFSSLFNRVLRKVSATELFGDE